MPASLNARAIADIGVYGHRGASIEQPENTLAAFRTAIEHGAEGIELDVAMSRDGVAVIMHDITIDRTTDGTGAVADLTLPELRQADAGNGERIPTLDEVLTLCAGNVDVNIELKSADAAHAVAEIVARHVGLQWFASGGQWQALRELARILPDARIYPLSLGARGFAAMREFAIASGYPAELLDREQERFSDLGRDLEESLAFAQEVHAEGISIWEHGLADADVARMHREGFQVWAWTINDPDRAEELMRMGVDGICTDDPAGIIARRNQVVAS